MLVGKGRGREEGSRTESVETVAYDEGKALEVGKVKELERELIRT